MVDWYIHTKAPISSDVWIVTHRRSGSSNRASDNRPGLPPRRRCCSSHNGLSLTLVIRKKTTIAGSTPAQSINRQAQSGLPLTSG